MPPAQEKDDASDLMDVLRRDLDATAKGSATTTQEHDPLAERPDEIDLDGRLKMTLPRPVPCTVITIAARSAGEAARLLQALPDRLDENVGRFPVKLELRLDMLPGFSERINGAALVLKLGVPVIFTLRTRTEGGHGTQTDAERQQALLTITSALRDAPPKGSLIDLEAACVAADPDGWSQVIQQARERGFEILLSSHEFDATTENAARLIPPRSLLDEAPGGPALLWKSAVPVRTWEQELALLRAQRRGNLGHRRASVMALGSPIARLLAPFTGTPLVYAAPDEEHAAVPGQVPFDDLVRLWARWGIEPDDEALAASVPAHEAPDPDDREKTTRLAARYAPRWCLIGRPAWHSLSPAMQNDAARRLGLPHRYFPLEIPEHTGAGSEDDLVRATLDTLPALGVQGGNVTVPYKRAVARLADRLEGHAETLQAVNTFLVTPEGIIGHNTDVDGVRNALEDDGRGPQAINGKRVLILGAGGSAAAALVAVQDAAHVTIANRTQANAEALVGSLAGAQEAPKQIDIIDWDYRHDAAKTCDVIIHATSIGMAGGPDPDGTPLDPSAISKHQIVVDLVYTPPTTTDPHDDRPNTTRTRLLREAATTGATVVDGTTILLHQGAAAFRIWTSEEPDIIHMRTAIDAAGRIPIASSIHAALDAHGVIG